MLFNDISHIVYFNPLLSDAGIEYATLDAEHLVNGLNNPTIIVVDNSHLTLAGLHYGSILKEIFSVGELRSYNFYP